MSSPYFEDLSQRYACELDDLRADSENKNVLERRLRDKRQAFASLLPLMEDAPEMLAAAFHGAFAFKDRRLLDQAANSVPGLGRFPRWAALEATLTTQAWARPLIAQCLSEPDGDAFLVTAAVLEWMLSEDIRRPDSRPDTDHDDRDQDEDDVTDLAEAGEGWMAEHGFDTPER